MTRLILSLGTALLLTAGTVWAGPLEDAATAYGRGDYAAALKTFQSLAAQGNAKAQNNLGVMYDNGQGVTGLYRSSQVVPPVRSAGQCVGAVQPRRDVCGRARGHTGLCSSVYVAQARSGKLEE